MVALTGLVFACAGQQKPRGPAGPVPATPPPSVREVPRPLEVPKDQGLIRIQCEPPDAVVVVDGVTRGVAADFSGERVLHLPAGTHRIELRKEGYATYRTEVYVAAEVLETIPVTLRRLPATAASSSEEPSP
ncbi:MAG: PEGA domain-containing protein [Deltaproteobacteria bacterium]|nr:MAG: PEGA domain-containing protein [Deltaproteobacteria bacterium]